MKIECTLPIAGESISGIKFAKSETGTMVSVGNVDPAQSERLLKIGGFRQFSQKPSEDSQATEKEAAEHAAAEKAAATAAKTAGKAKG